MNTVPRRLLVLFSLALLLPAPNLHAVAIDADVISVVSAGQWQSDVIYKSAQRVSSRFELFPNQTVVVVRARG